jgi:predicted PhzF superfamily epimerase YddE/YHI9
VVLCEEPPARARCLQLAAELGCPDTAFVVRTPDDGTWEVASYSPYEELSLCTQTLLAAESVLNDGRGSLLAKIPSRVIEMRRMPASDSAWVVFPAEGFHAPRSTASVREVLGPVTLTGEECVIDAGRRRVYARLGSVADLEQVVLEAAIAKELCAAAGIHGICLLAEDAGGPLRLRVFTTSLDGAEDCATGGAVAALPTYFDALGETRRYPLRVEQGMGPPQRRGTLFVGATPEGAEVSGATQLVAHGQLVLS